MSVPLSGWDVLVLMGFLQGMGEMGYICLQCGKTFTSLDVLNLIRPGGLTFYCDQCDSELQHNQDEDEIEKRKDRVQRFNAQVERIREGLKQTEGMIMRKWVIPILLLSRTHITLPELISRIGSRNIPQSHRRPTATHPKLAASLLLLERNQSLRSKFTRSY